MLSLGNVRHTHGGVPDVRVTLPWGNVRHTHGGVPAGPDVTWCVYAYGTNNTVGRARMTDLAAHMRRIRMPYTAVAASGPVSSFVPCLHQAGYVGMWRSLLRIWRNARHHCPHEWVVVLESDARPPFDFALRLQRSLRPTQQVVWLDQRTGYGPGPSGCCTNAVAYHRSVLPGLVSHFDPHNRKALWNGYANRTLPVVRDGTCLTDWYLGNVVATERWRASRRGTVPHFSTASELAAVAAAFHRRLTADSGADTVGRSQRRRET